MSIKNKSFMWYIPAAVGNWFVYTILATIIPLYGELALKDVPPKLLSLLLAISFLSAVLFITILWKPVVRKVGARKAWIYSMLVWIGTLILLLFIKTFIEAVIVFFLIGMGLAGSLYMIDIIVSDIVDEDEVKTGIRREAGYYGSNALFIRLSAVFVFLAIGPVFISADLVVYTPDMITDEFIFGLRALMSIFPIIALTIAILSIYKYPLHGETLKKVKEELEKIHIEKKLNV